VKSCNEILDGPAQDPFGIYRIAQDLEKDSLGPYKIQQNLTLDYTRDLTGPLQDLNLWYRILSGSWEVYMPGRLSYPMVGMLVHCLR